ncbi:MAG: hypothetical protein ACOCX6_00115 [bacterium]
MKNRRRLIPLFLGLLGCAALTLGAAGCSMSVPFLYVDVESDYYFPDEVRIHYLFQSESEFQACRITISSPSLPEDEVIIEEEAVLPNQGSLGWWELAPGAYTLRFSVLSRRGTSLNVLPFLDKSYDFVVH